MNHHGKTFTHDGAYLPGLIWTLIRTDFKTRYHGTFGSYLWALVKPCSIFIVLYMVFSVIFAMDPHYSMNLIIGLFLWDFFSDSTRTGFIALQTKAFLLTKTKFPSWVVILTSLSNALITVIIFSSDRVIAKKCSCYEKYYKNKNH